MNQPEIAMLDNAPVNMDRASVTETAKKSRKPETDREVEDLCLIEVRNVANAMSCD
jgi:hypothetical protein